MPRLRLSHISLALQDMASASDEADLLLRQAAAKCRVSPRQITDLTIIKKSLDARDKGRPVFVYTLDATAPAKAKGETAPAEVPLEIERIESGAPRPLVVGAGPAGLFAAWALSRAGLRPIVAEQGKPVSERELDVSRFWAEGRLDPLSNIQFGEGGAGAFSDGKLTSRSKDPLGREVLRLLVACGADPSITYWHKPHLGSDRLPGIIANLRREIQALGGEFSFSTRLTGLTVSAGRLCGAALEGPFGRKELAVDRLILAVGNGARGVYRMLAETGIALEAKAFAVGVRVEQEQAAVDRAQYGDFAGHPMLTAADYSLTYRGPDRGFYTFCNCPGGFVVNASSEPDGVVTNGVSLAARDGKRCNAAAVGEVRPGRDFGAYELDGLEFQLALERAAYTLAGGGHALPVSSAALFCGGGAGEIAPAAKSAAVKEADLRELFSEELGCGLAQALLHWGKMLPGFLHSAVLYGAESRTSAPVRILRGRDRQSLNCAGLYPAGEGAGYAGGIVSSAIDGLHAALAIIESLR
ncbi:MAG: FAD-binding protein [Firmicutes bacterium]|nr:FAD-binding protein [Bacillota bacterium]